jgi:SWI/SNF-related matrix-associated actin-dependent regulator of chromatin subfamily A member 5
MSEDGGETKVVTECPCFDHSADYDILKGAAPPSASKIAKMQQSAERQQKKQNRKVAEGKLQMKRQEMDKAKVCARFTSFCLLSHAF